MERKRKVTEAQLAQMTDEQLAKIEEKLGAKLRGLVDKTCEEANKLLEIYGLQTKMQIVIEKKQ